MLRRLVVRSCAAAAAAGAPRLAARPVASTPLRAAPRAAPQRTFAVKEITSQAELESVVRDNPGKLVVRMGDAKGRRGACAALARCAAALRSATARS
jgi:hypothetical protein